MPVASLSHLAGKVTFGEVGKEEIKKNEKKIGKELFEKLYQDFMTGYFEKLTMFGKPMSWFEKPLRPEPGSWDGWYDGEEPCYMYSYSTLRITARNLKLRFGAKWDDPNHCKVNLKFIGLYSWKTEEFIPVCPLGVRDFPDPKLPIEKDTQLVYRWQVINPKLHPYHNFIVNYKYEGTLLTGNKNYYPTKAWNIQDGRDERWGLNAEQLYTLCKIADLSLSDADIQKPGDLPNIFKN